MSKSDDEVAQELEDRLDAFKQMAVRYAAAMGLSPATAEEGLRLLERVEGKRLVGFQIISTTHDETKVEFRFE